MVQLSLWGLLSQEVEASLRQPLLRELLRLPILPRLLELPLSLLSVIRPHGSRQQAAGSRQQAAGSRQQAAGSRQQAAGSRQQAAGLTFRPLPRLAENEEPGCTRGGTGGRGGLVEMTRRKREIAGLANEQDFPYLVELALPPGGFRSVFQEIDAFHRERHIPVRRGRSRYEVEPFYIRFCFPDAATADAFRNRFGGVTRAPVKPSRGPRLRRRRRTGAQSDGVRAVQYGRR